MLFLFAALAAPCSVTVENGVYQPTHTVGFTPSTADPTEDAVKAMTELACSLTEDETRSVHIGVHTDSKGSGGFNRAMSQKRADALKAALVGAGVTPSQVTARGYGEDYPVGSNATAEGRNENRRVELLTTDPGRPEPSAPAPVPASEPAPSASQTLCTQVRRMLPEAGELSTPLSPDAAAAAITACLPGWKTDRDGVERYLSGPDGVLRIRPAGSGTTLDFTPHQPGAGPQ